MSKTDSDSSSSDSDTDEENKGWSTGKKVALGVGVGVAALIGGYELIHHIGDSQHIGDSHHGDIDDEHLNDHNFDDKGYNYLHDYKDEANGGTIILIGRPGCVKSVEVKEFIEAHREIIENEYENIFLFNTESYSDVHEGNYIDKMSFWDDVVGTGGLPAIAKKKSGDTEWITYDSHDYGDALLDWMTS